MLTESLATGVAQGTRLTRDELQGMIRDYYGARRWDENGRIPEARLRELDLPGGREGA